MLLSAEKGKISAAARGARNPKSKLAAVAQPFTLAKFLLAKGRSFAIVSQAEVENAHTHLAGNLFKTAWASYFCELADAIPEGMPEAELFHLLEAALRSLNDAQSTEQAEVLGHWFEARYLALLGYAPTMGRCLQCAAKISVPAEESERLLAFSAALGGTLCTACAPIDPGRMNVRVQSLRALHQLERAALPPTAEKFIGRLFLTTAAGRDLREVLRRSLGSHLGIKWKSRAFLDEVLASSTSD